MNAPAPRRFGKLLCLFHLLCAGATSASAQLIWGQGGSGGDGVWNSASTNWWNGTTNVVWNDGTAVFAGSAGTVVSSTFEVTAAGMIFNTAGYVIQNGWLFTTPSFNVVANADATITTTLSTRSGTGTLTKSGPARLSVLGTNFIANVQVNEGEYYTGSLFSKVTLADAPNVLVTLGSSSVSMGSLSGGGLNGGVVQPAANLAAVTLFPGGTGSFGGTLRDNGTAMLSLNVAGTQALTNTNPYTGSTAVSSKLTLSGGGALTGTSRIQLSGGELTLENAAQALGDRLNDTAPLTVAGGSLRVLGNGSTVVEEVAGALTYSKGSTVTMTASGGTGVALVLAGLSRSGHGTLSVSGNGALRVPTATMSGGILPTTITSAGDWATLGVNGAILPFSAYATDLNAAGSEDHVKLTGSGMTLLAASGSRATLNLQAGAQVDLTGRDLVLSQGGLLSSGAGTAALRGGSLRVIGGELVVTNQNAFNLAANVQDNGGAMTVTKSGAGTLTLGGANTFTGDIYVNGGTLSLATAKSAGLGTTIHLDGGGLQAIGDVALAKTIAGSGTVDTNGYNLTLSGSINGNINKIGLGSLVLASPALGSVNVSAGTLVAPRATSGSVTLGSASLEAAGRLVSLSANGTGALLSPGGREVETLIIDSFSATGRLTLQMDVGAAGSDYVYMAQVNNFSSFSPGFSLDFDDAGGATTGVDYPLLATAINSGSNGGGFRGFQVSDFSLSSEALKEGWRGTFKLADNGIAINFTAVPVAVPEPGSAMLVLLCAAFLGMRRPPAPLRMKLESRPEAQIRFPGRT